MDQQASPGVPGQPSAPLACGNLPETTPTSASLTSNNMAGFSESSARDTQALLVHQALSEEDTEDFNPPLRTGNCVMVNLGMIAANFLVTASQKSSKWSQFKQHPVIQFLRSWWRTLVILLPPLLLLPLPILWKTDVSLSVGIDMPPSAHARTVQCIH